MNAYKCFSSQIFPLQQKLSSISQLFLKFEESSLKHCLKFDIAFCKILFVLFVKLKLGRTAMSFREMKFLYKQLSSDLSFIWRTNQWSWGFFDCFWLPTFSNLIQSWFRLHFPPLQVSWSKKVIHVSVSIKCSLKALIIFLSIVVTVNHPLHAVKYFN